MTDLTITAANVKAAANATTRSGQAGASITAGQLVYLDGTTGTYNLSDADLTGAKQVTGVALNGASSGQPLTVQTGGDISIGATLTPGATYYLSGTAGGIAPLADLSTGEEVVLVGIAKSTSVLALKITDTGVTSA
jgi:hypothetical protein